MKMATKSHAARELPLEELLALYGYTMSNPDKKSCKMAASLPGMTLDKGQITEGLFPGEEEDEESADDLTPSVTSNTSDPLHRLRGGNKDTLVSSSDEESDDTSVPSNEEHKEIMVGSMYQAKIPPLCSYTYQEKAYSSEDQLLWKPGVLPVHEVEEFLLNTQRPRGETGAARTLTHAVTVRDNEQALYELIKCNFNAEEALRRFHFNVKVVSDELCSWSEEECRSFEHGYRVYGKNFHLIQANKVRTRSVGECVEYYYMWKKSERHEYFTQQTTRLTRRKYSLQSGSMEDGEQDGEVGELERSNNSSSLLSRSSVGRTRQLGSPLPQRTKKDLNKRDAEAVTGWSQLCGDRYPEPPFGRPFPPQPPDDPVILRPSAQFQLLTRPSACETPQGSCFYQLHMRGGPLLPEDPDRSPAAGGAHGLQVPFGLPMSFSPPSSPVLSSHLQADVLLPSTSHSLTQCADTD